MKESMQMGRASPMFQVETRLVSKSVILEYGVF